MQHHLRLPIVLTFCLILLLATSVGIWRWSQSMQPLFTQDILPIKDKNTIPALVVNEYSPVSLIGTVIEIGTSTVTIEGQPPGNTTPVQLLVFVDAKTSITKVGPAPDFATSTATFKNLKEGMLLNIEAAGATQMGSTRHAERIIIPPPQ